MAYCDDHLYERLGLFCCIDSISGWAMDRDGIMSEKIALIIILMIAGIYVFKYMKKMLTVGENEEKCNACPVDKITFQQKKTKNIL